MDYKEIRQKLKEIGLTAQHMGTYYIHSFIQVWNFKNNLLYLFNETNITYSNSHGWSIIIFYSNTKYNSIKTLQRFKFLERI